MEETKEGGLEIVKVDPEALDYYGFTLEDLALLSVLRAKIKRVSDN